MCLLSSNLHKIQLVPDHPEHSYRVSHVRMLLAVVQSACNMPTAQKEIPITF
jgi:hypothetical protein